MAMSEHDAASIVGQLAGLNSGNPSVSPVIPEDLISRFCDDRAEGLRADPGTTVDAGTTINRGWCGYIGGRGESMAVGFDDGYDFLGFLGDHGWKPLSAKGNWPYVVYLATRDEDHWVVAGYCEADLTVWQFSTEGDFRNFYEGLEDLS
jgi:hypothetical protein